MTAVFEATMNIKVYYDGMRQWAKFCIAVVK